LLFKNFPPILSKIRHANPNLFLSVIRHLLFGRGL
jgi:hypothetical protein